MKTIAAIAALLLLVTFAVAQQSPVTAPERRTIPADVASGLLCGSSLTPSTSDTANSQGKKTPHGTNSLCGGPILPPLYPAAAKQQGVEGAVLLKAVIGKDGTVRELRIIDGHPLLAPAAIEAVKRWTYKPYYVDGKPVEVETTITVNFTLQKGSTQSR